MFEKRFALLAEADDGDGAGGGASGGGSPEGGQGKSPEDGETVSKKQFLGALKSAEEKRKAEVAALQSQLQELQAQVKAKPADQPKRYTRQQLNAAVEAGQITQEQADAQLDAQLREEAEERAHRVALETVSVVERKKLVDSEIERYKAAAPEILDDDHGTRQRIKQEFQGLVALGDSPKDVATQLKAIRMVLGPIERLERSRSGRDDHDSHRETGGSGGGGSGPKKTGKVSERLNAEARRHYEKLIDRGVYKDWDAVDAELKFAKPATRQRLGIG
jgi:hypothetical protein